MQQAVGLLVVDDALRAGEHGVVVGQHHAARGLLAELRGIDGAQARHQTIGRALVDQLGLGEAAALRGQCQAAVLQEAAFVQDITDVLARRAVALGVAPGHGLGAASIGQQRMALDHLGQVGADVVGAWRVVMHSPRTGIAFEGLQRQQGLAFGHDGAGFGQQRQHAAGLRRGDLELHLHGFDDGQALACGHGVIGLDQPAHQRAGHTGAHRQAMGQGSVQRIPTFRAGLHLINPASGEPGRRQVRAGGGQLGHAALQPAGAHAVTRQVGMAQHGLQERQVAVHPFQAELGQRAARPHQQRVESAAALMHDHLGQQCVEAWMGLEAGMAMAIHPNARPTGGLVGAHRAAGGQRAAFGVHAFHIHAQLHGLALGRRDVGLAQAQRGQGGALRQLQLRPHQVQPGDLLGHRVLHLKARVGLHEIEAARVRHIDQELEGAQAAQAHLACQAQRGFQQAVTQGRIQIRRGRDLHQLLVVALHGAIALPGMAHSALPVAQRLHLHMTCTLHQLLHIDIATPEGGLRLRLAALIERRDILWPFDHAHASPAAAGQRLDHHRAALTQAGQEGLRLGQADGVVQARRHRHVAGLGQRAGAGLVAQQVQRLGRGAHEHQSGCGTSTREGRALAQEAVARVHVGAALGQGGGHHVVDVQIGRHATAGQQVHRIHVAGMQRGLVVLRHDAHRTPAQVGRRTGNADGDLAPVGDQQAGYGVRQKRHGGGQCRQSIRRDTGVARRLPS